MVNYPREVEHSDKYQDDLYEYKHVCLPKNIFERIPRGKLLSESEWRKLGISQSRGWVHYSIHKPEPHILLFRRPIGTDPKTGNVPNVISFKIIDENKIRRNNLLENYDLREC